MVPVKFSLFDKCFQDQWFLEDHTLIWLGLACQILKIHDLAIQVLAVQDLAIQYLKIQDLAIQDFTNVLKIFENHLKKDLTIQY